MGAAPRLFEGGVKLISYCPLCESSYNPREAHVLGEKEDSYLLHITCGNCRNAVIALVLISSVGISSVGLVTDMTFAEYRKFREAAPVTMDDVIDIHNELKTQEQRFIIGCLLTEPV